MTYTNHSLFTVPLTSQAYRLAKTLSSQYEYPRKAQQVYLNTLAVYAVATYCECLEIDTNLEASDSLNSVMQPLMDIADLEIERIGKLECRPLSVNEEKCHIPVETWENRIGYIAVEIDHEEKEATLLGFYPPVNPLEMIEWIPIQEFKPLEAFIDYLHQIESGIEPVSFFFEKTSISEWLQNMAQTIHPVLPSAWQDLEYFLIGKPENFSLRFATGFRGQTNTSGLSITKIKEIQLGDHLLALTINGEKKNNGIVDLLVRLYPSSEAEISLPSGIKLIRINESEERVSISRDADNWIQLAFECHWEEQFNITVEWAEERFSEDFII